MARIAVNRNGKIEEHYPKNLTTDELCHILKSINIDGGSWMPETAEKEGYAAINEAIRRLKNMKEVK